MSAPRASVVIAVHNGADLLGEAIDSVLAQTLSDFELIVVDDASRDATPEVLAAIRDPRLRCLTHPVNQGLLPARNTGIRAAQAPLLFFLDHDDRFHPDKLAAHVALHAARPEVGFSYNPRFELDYSATTIRHIWRPAAALALGDLVLGFPIAPSDMVLRRTWAERIGLWDASHGFYGGEIMLTGRLRFAGCPFARVDRALNYRRHHSGRHYADIAAFCQSEIAAQEKILGDPRCPPEVVALRDKAWSNSYLVWQYHAFAQEETALAHTLVREAVRLDPDLLAGAPCPLVQHWIDYSAADASVDHVALLERIFAQLPAELRPLAAQQPAAAARGHMQRAMTAALWERPDAARASAAAARASGGANDFFLRRWVQFLLDYEAVFDGARARAALNRLARTLAEMDPSGDPRRLRGLYWAAHAFTSYADNRHRQVPGDVVRAFLEQPRGLVDRGLLSIALRSLVTGAVARGGGTKGARD